MFVRSLALLTSLTLPLFACSGEPPARLSISKQSGDAKPGSKGEISDGDSDGKLPSDGEPRDTPEELPTDDGGDENGDDPLDPPVEPEPEAKPLNETGGSEDNDAVPIPMPEDDKGTSIDPYKAPRMILSENTKECLDLDGNTNRNGEVIQGRPCSGTTGQMIEIKKVDGNYVTLSFLGSKGCWMLKGGSSEKRTILEQWKCDGSQAQKWKLEKVRGNSFSIRPALNANRCVDMDTNGPKVRSTLQIYDCLGNPQQTWTLLRKDAGFVPKPQPVLSLDDVCHHKIRVYENDTSAAGKLIYETLGGRLMDRVPEVAKEVCRVLYEKPSEVIANINYMSVYVEPNLPGGIAAIAKAEGYKDSSMKMSARHFQEKKSAGYDIAKFLKGTMAFELTHVFQYPLNANANEKLKVLHEALAYAVRLRTYPDQSWKRNKSGNWEQGGLQAGLFLIYVDAKHPGFLRKLNALMDKSVDEKVVAQAAGVPIEELWQAYQSDASCTAANLVCGR